MNLRLSPLLCVVPLLSCVPGSTAPTLNVVTSPGEFVIRHYTAYLVIHGGNSSDLDSYVERELRGRGFDVSVGPEGGEPPAAELLVKYDERWNWDFGMYLQSFELTVFDAKSKIFLASGTWKDAVLHGFHSAEKVVGQVVAETLAKLGERS